MKVILLGSLAAGKTSLMCRYIYQTFAPTCTTIGAACVHKNVESKGRSYLLAIWDTSGSERFDSLTSLYCRTARAAIICYDLTCRKSFESLDRMSLPIRTIPGSLCTLAWLLTR